MMIALDDEQTTPSPASNQKDQRESASEPLPEAAADPRTTIAGRYSIDLQSHPDNAGIAVVYQGRDLRTRDPVLVKTLRLEYRGDPEMRARFRREARLLQFLSHPHVIRALTFVEERGAPWLVLERVPGRALREAMTNGVPLSPEEVVPLLNGMAAALDHLHARGLVHLDVRPENVMVAPDGTVKLTDFGVAQTAGILQEHIDAGSELIAYLAPEQISGKPVTIETDVFALGCVVYELLTGQSPFASSVTPADRNAALRARLDMSAAPPTVARGGNVLPAWVDDVVLGAIEREPRQRYGSAGSFAAVFHSGVEGEVDVETGRPRMPTQTPGMRHFPLNEPGIAVKGSRLLGTRRGQRPVDGQATSDPVVDARFSPVSLEKPIAFRYGRRLGGLDVEALVRRLWQVVVLAAILNVLLIAALVATRGEIPGIWQRAVQIGPGVSVSVAGTGLVARAEPSVDSAIVANLPDGGEVRISGDAVAGEDGLWWPVEVTTEDGIVRGYVPQSWLQQP